MRLNDLSDGSIKTLLILGLLLANIAVAFSNRHADARPPGSAPTARMPFVRRDAPTPLEMQPQNDKTRMTRSDVESSPFTSQFVIRSFPRASSFGLRH